MTAPTSLPNSPSESRSQSTHQRQNGRFKTAVADHPQWRENLAKRHILEAVIKAGAWVEWDQEAQQDVLVWREKRRDGSPGATRRRLLQPISDNGKTPAKVRWQFRGQKTDEPFFYVGTLDNLKLHITAAGGRLYIVEGEFDVWSLRRLGMRNVIGIYGISNIPKDIASLFNNLGVSRFIFYADNDEAGDRGASNMRTLLHESAWQGESEYRQFAGPGIPEKGDANDLLCHHYPDLSAARAALGALPRFEPNLKRKKAVKPASAIDCHDERWGAVNEANRIALGVTYFKANGFSKNIRCPNPDHEDKTPSAALHKDGFCTCQVCGTFNSKQLADWVDIDWRALLRPQPQIVSSKDTDLAAAPQTVAETAPLSFEQAPDSWLRLLNKFYKPTVALLFLYILRARKAGLLIPDFTRGECIKAVRELGCNVSDGAIYKVFQQVGKHDDQPLFVKADPSGGSSVKNRKFQLRQLDDIRRRLLHGIRYRVYESTFHKQRDTLINFKVFDQARLGSEFTKSLESALEPLYREQKPRFEALKHICEQKIATYQAELDDLHATPLPDWPIDQPCELPALLARGIYEADPEDHSKREWARLLGISKANVDAALTRAGIQRRAYTKREEVDSPREAKDRARELGAKIVGLEVDGGYQRYDAAMDIPQDSKVIYQPPAKHEIISDEKQIVKAPPPKTRPASATDTKPQRADNMRKPGNWHEPKWDPQFIYWELVKACCLLHGYAVKDSVGIYDPQTGEIWTNPTLDEVVGLIIGEAGVAKSDTS